MKGGEPKTAWLLLSPNQTVLNNPTYFPPRYFAPFISYLGSVQENFRLFVSREGLMVEVEDHAAPSVIEYAKALLKADAQRVRPPALNYVYRLEATLSKPCALPISYLNRSYIDRAAPASPNQMHLPVPADAVFSAVMERGTAVEVIGRQSQKAQEEVNAYIVRLQRRKKVKEGVPVPGGEIIDQAGAAVFGYGTEKSEARHIEPVKDRKLDAASEKATSKVFECNIFVYGDTEEDVNATLSAMPSSPMNSLKIYSVKRLKRKEEGSGTGSGRSAQGSAPYDNGSGTANSGSGMGNAGSAPSGGGEGAPPPIYQTTPSDPEDFVLEDITDAAREARTGSGGAGAGAGAVTGAVESRGAGGWGWKFARFPSGHFVARHRSSILKYAAAAAVLSALVLHLQEMAQSGIYLQSLIRDPSPALSSPLTFFLPEIATAIAVFGAFAVIFAMTRQYRRVGLSEFELASIFSFPSPSLLEGGVEVEQPPTAETASETPAPSQNSRPEPASGREMAEGEGVYWEEF